MIRSNRNYPRIREESAVGDSGYNMMQFMFIDVWKEGHKMRLDKAEDYSKIPFYMYTNASMLWKTDKLRT